MSPLIKKEIRLLFPGWIAAMLLAVFPTIFFGLQGWANFVIPPFAMGVGLLFLAISSFGQEFSFGSFGVLLSQPAERRRIWTIKTGTLLSAFAMVILAFLLSYLVACLYANTSLEKNFPAIYLHRPPLFYSFLEELGMVSLTATAIFSSGLWATLLLRQVAAAFWAALLVPWFTYIGINIALNWLNVPNETLDTIAAIVLLLYSAAGFLWARRLFLRAQDTQWTGGEFSFSWSRKTAGHETTAALSKARHWLSACVWKEIQLHQVNFLIAIVVLALHLMSVVIRKIHPHFVNPNLDFFIETVWVLWLLMPLLIGCAAVAEERKLAVLESQLCQPVSRRLQFSVKFFIALIFSVILGAVVPSVIEWTPNFGLSLWPNYWIFYAAPALFFISFYASTLSRSALPAIGTAIAIPIIVGFEAVLLFMLVLHFADYPRYVLGGLAICLLYLGIPVLVLVMARLTFWNFKWLHENRRLWQTNITVVVASIVAIYVLATAFFYRPWEWLSSLDYPRGPARLTAGTPVKLFSEWNTLAAALPDGRLWYEDFDTTYVNMGEHSFGWMVEFPALHTQQFIGGSDWRKISANFHFILGIHSDGSLWSVPQFWNNRLGRNFPEKPVQIGSDKDWGDVASDGGFFLLLKSNGSLWAWGANDSRDTRLMFRIGDETNWSDLLTPAGGAALVQKRDGSLWAWEPRVNRLFNFTNWNNQWMSYSDNYQWSAGIKTNGHLWFFSHPQGNWDGSQPAYSQKVQLGSSSAWKAIAFSLSDSLILLRDDGTLWKWNPSKLPPFGWDAPEPFHPVQLGRQSDWVALSSYGQHGIALAADGSLWAWDQPSRYVWLAPSRKPMYMGNIFQGAADNP